MGNAPTASHSLTIRLEIQNQPGMLGKVTSAIGKAGGDIGAIDLVEVRKKTIIRDLTFKASDERHGQQVVERLKAIEGKALIFKEFAGVDAWPLCLATKDVDEIVTIVKAISPAFGGINLEDISAPRCFEIEERLQKALDIPVFHDDQHGTAVVVLAALINALKVVKKRLPDVRIVITGAGASGIATAKLLMKEGAKHIVGCDRAGAIYAGRTENMNSMKEWFAKHTNPRKIRGTAGEALVDADVFIGLSGPGVVSLKDVKAMNRDAIVFAMANPVPEIQPEEAGPFVRVMATGRSDYPNQINNSCCFPGFFRGMLDVRAKRVNDQMKLAAAHALAAIVAKSELSDEYITPSMFDARVVPAVAAAVAEAAIKTGVARKQRR